MDDGDAHDLLNLQGAKVNGTYVSLNVHMDGFQKSRGLAQRMSRKQA